MKKLTMLASALALTLCMNQSYADYADSLQTHINEARGHEDLFESNPLEYFRIMFTFAQCLINSYDSNELAPGYVEAAKLFATMAEAFFEAGKENHSNELLRAAKDKVPDLFANAEVLIANQNG